MFLWFSFAVALPQYICTNLWIFMKYDVDIQQVHWRLPHLHTFNLMSLVILSWWKLNFRAGSNISAMDDLCHLLTAVCRMKMWLLYGIFI